MTLRASPIVVAASNRHSATHLELPNDLSFDDWCAIGDQLGRADRALSWWVGDWWAFGRHLYGERTAIVSADDWQGPSVQTCLNCSNVAKSFETNRRRLVLSFTHHAEVAALPSVVADALLDRAEAEQLSVMQLRALVRRYRATVRIGEMVNQPLPVHEPVSVLYVDPPWRYENPPMGGGNRSIENHYPTMELEEICALNMAQCATDDAVLFMWATAPKLAECFEVLKAWTFIYRTNFVWDKVRIGMGYHVRNRHELLLIAKRGELPPPAPEDRPASVIAAERSSDHSAKPAIFAEMIERMYPTLRKREFFSRDPGRPGWEEPWGNQQIAVAAAMAAE